MAPRALGALLALVAAIAFVVSIVSSAWWAGPPTVNGRESHKKEVRVGLLGATGCNTGGDGSCEPLPIGGTFDIATKAELGMVSLAALLALLLGVSAWRVGDGRKGMAKASLLVALLAAAGGGAVLLLGPDIQASQAIDVPIGWGAFVFGGGVVANLIASAITRKLEPEPLRLKPSMAVLPQAALPQQAPADPASIMGAAPQQLRPLYDSPHQGFGPPSQAGVASQGLPSSQAGASNQGFVPPSQAAAPAPRAPTTLTPSSPLMSPMPPVVRPLTAQMPPPSALPERADTQSVEPPPPATLAAAAIPAPPRVKGPSMPPPVRSKGPSAPPPLPAPGDPLGPPVDPFARTAPNEGRGVAPPLAPPPPRAKPTAPPMKPVVATKPPAGPPVNTPRSSSTSAPPPRANASWSSPARSPASARSSSPSAAPPPNANASSSQAGPANGPRSSIPSASAVASRAKPSVPPPLAARAPASPPVKGPRAGTVQGTGTDPSLVALPRSSAPAISVEKRPSQPTIAHAVPPMPSDDIAPSRRAATEADDRLETAMRPTDYLSAVEMDAESTVAGEAPPSRGAADTSPTGAPSVGDDTDASIGAGALSLADGFAAQQHDGGDPSHHDAADSSHHDGTDATDPSRRAGDVYARTANHTPIPTHTHDASHTPIPTHARDASHPPTRDANHPPTHDASHPLARDAIHTPIPSRAPAQVPISTAPSTLPPPKATQTTVSGPTPACPQCEAPMAWVDEHLRFYCKSCRMYF